MNFSYDNRKFRSITNSTGGDVGAETVFHYHQEGRSVWAEYAGGDISIGRLVATCGDDGVLDIRYMHINMRGELKTGTCCSTLERLADGRIRLYEKWQWTCDDRSSGESVIEEIS